jgi:hypothetical protein
MFYAPSFTVTTSDLHYIKHVRSNYYKGRYENHYIEIGRQNCQQTIGLNERNDNWHSIYSEAKYKLDEEFLFFDEGFVNKKFVTGMMDLNDGTIVVCFNDKSDWVNFTCSYANDIIAKWTRYYLNKTRDKKPEPDNKEPLIEKITELIDALTYAPGGLIAQKAGEDFSKLVKS